MVLYPFRDSIHKELSYYAALKRLEGCLKNDLSSTYSILDEKAKGRDEKRSIQRLTEGEFLKLSMIEFTRFSNHGSQRIHPSDVSFLPRSLSHQLSSYL